MAENKNTKEEQKENENNQQNQVEQHKQQESNQDAPEPDVILDVPKLKVDEISLKVDDLKAKVSLSAKLADFVQIDVGADVHIKTVDLDVKGVEAEAHLRVRLERVKQILNRTLETIDNNPDILKAMLEPEGEGAGKASGETGKGEGNALGGMAEKAGNALGAEKVKDAVKGIGNKISDLTSSDEDVGSDGSDEADVSAGSESRKS